MFALSGIIGIRFFSNKDWMEEGIEDSNATSTKISGSSISAGWKNAKQKRSGGSIRLREILPAFDFVNCFILDDLFQYWGWRIPSYFWSTRKPRLNQELKRWWKSWSTQVNSGWSWISSNKSTLILTNSLVEPGARFRRRISSWRLGSAAIWRP